MKGRDSGLRGRLCCDQSQVMKRPTLYLLAGERKYDQIPSRVVEYPSDVFWSDNQGSTALHLLCQVSNVDRSLLTAVESIVKEFPSLIAAGKTQDARNACAQLQAMADAHRLPDVPISNLSSKLEARNHG